MPALLALVLLAVEPEALLRQGEQALKELDYRAAASAFERACLDAPCSRAQLLRAHVGLATTLSSLMQAQRAAEAFKVLLFLSPGWTLPPGASPRIREPFEAAQLFWRSRAAPRLVFKPVALEPNAPATLTVELEADPLALASSLVVVVRRDDRELRLPGAGRVELSDGGFSQAFALEPALTAPGALTLVAQALSASGSVLLETTLERTIAGGAPAAAPAAAAQEPPAARPAGRALLHLSVTAAFDALSRQLGVEALAALSPVRFVDVALGATFGANVGLRLLAAVHLPRSYRVSPFGALRLGLHPSAGPAVGAGLALGVTVEAGPGRVTASLAGELFSAAAPFRPAGLLAFVGYEVDLPGLEVD